jgi:hypothetical protein
MTKNTSSAPERTRHQAEEHIPRVLEASHNEMQKPFGAQTENEDETGARTHMDDEETVAPVHTGNMEDFASVPKKKPRQTNVPIFKVAPPRCLGFPQQGDITAAEIFTFLPNSARSHDIAFRFATNGMNNQTAATIANYFRASEKQKKVTANTICKLFQQPMRASMQYKYTVVEELHGKEVVKEKMWSVGLHQRFNTKSMWEAVNGPWDSKSLSLAGMNVDVGARHVLVNNVPFASLADGVHRFPSIEEGDGLNLTRCVLYAVTHPEEDLKFPRDFAALTDRVGAAPVQPQHYDEATFKRWKGRAEAPLPTTIVTPSPYLTGMPSLGAAAGSSPALPPSIVPTVATPSNPVLPDSSTPTLASASVSDASAANTAEFVAKLHKTSNKTIKKLVQGWSTAQRAAAQARQTNLENMVDNGRLVLSSSSAADPAAQYSIKVEQPPDVTSGFPGGYHARNLTFKRPSQSGYDPLQIAPGSLGNYHQGTVDSVMNGVTDHPAFANKQLDGHVDWKTPTANEFNMMMTNITQKPPTSWTGYNNSWSHFDVGPHGNTIYSGYSAQTEFGANPALTGELAPMNNVQQS